jgi:exodeoxyribonuclease V beta subunit
MDSYAGAFESSTVEPKERSVFTFPRGATAGTAIHKLFEDETFSFRGVQEKDYSKLISNVLTRFGFDEEWEEVAATMMENVALASIPGLQLSEVGKEDQLREMEFLFQTVNADADMLYPVIRQGRKGHESGNPDGFMTGFIDLIVRQNGQYFILDYKSNHLGDHIDDYNSERLKEEIEANGYDLQYHLYTVALVKFLKKRVPDFDYDKHFGGVAYLFVRGMQKGEESGVWFHKPDREVIKNLNDFLGGN